MKYFYISFFGLFGAWARYFIKTQHFSFYSGSIPINTVIINLTGCFILGAFLTYSTKIKIKENLQLGLSVGFVGTYTTFSSFCKDNVQLFLKSDYSSLFFYLLISILGGLIMVYLGKLLVEAITPRSLVGDLQ